MLTQLGGFVLSNRIADLTVKLSTDSATFKREVDQAKLLLRGYGREANTAQRSNDKFSSGFGQSAGRVASGAGKIVSGLGAVAGGFTAFIAAGTATIAIIGSIAGSQALMAREMDSMSLRSGVAVSELQQMAYATGQYNISADKTADILKDLTDKTGDYLATGGGEFADFFENVGSKVGLTAEKLAEMSGPNALIAVKAAMDDTNTSAAEQVFYLESIADEASSLIPLLANNGEELRKMDARFKGLNATLTQSEITQLKKYQLNVDDLSLAWQAFSREAILPWVDQLGDAAQYLAQIFSTGRKNQLRESISDSHIEMLSLNEEIAGLEEKVKNGPKYGGVGIIDALLGNTDNAKILADKKAELDKVREDLAQYQERMAQLQGKPASGSKKPDGGGISPGAQADIDALNKKGVDRLAVLDRQYTDEQGRLALDNQAQLDAIAGLQVSKEDLEARGFESIDELRAEYSAKQREYFEQQSAETLARQQEAAQKEIDALAQKEQQKTDLAERAARQRADTEERIEQQLLSARFQLAGQALGLVASSAKEGSALQKAAFVAQKAMAASQIYIQGEVAAAAALSLPPFGLGPIAGAGLAGSIRLTAAASAGLVLGQAVAGFRELGGPVQSGMPYIVGEKGPEVFTPGAGGQITSNSNLKRMGGSGTVVNIHNAPPGTYSEKSSKNGMDFVDVFLSDLDGDDRMSQGIQQRFDVKRR